MHTQGSFRVSRRRIMTAGGAILVGTALVPAFDVFGQQRGLRGVITKDGGSKQVFLPEEGAKDPLAHSVAENLFWTDILMEHAKFSRC